ncbi:MAG: hypothetical protein OXI24_12375, partial [Candidatus Poribacteria bacterium]|nr:hypothetical protein [Candidatus Poribacteria bacterium]
MKKHIFILLLLFLISLPFADAESPNGTIPLDCPEVPNPKFQFHFTRELISLAVTTFPFNTVENIYIHVYDDEVGLFDKLVQYYAENLEAENWHNSHEDSTTRLSILERPITVESRQADNTVLGLFAIVQGDGDVYLLNIVGNVPPQQVRKLLMDLGDIGIDIPALKLIGELSLPKPEEPSSGMPLPTLFRMRKDSASANKTDSALFSTSFEENHQGHWTYRGHPIERIQIRSSDIKHVTVVSSGLKNGPEDITGLLDGLSSNTDSREIPKFIVLPSEKTITITAGNMSDETQPTTLTKVFQTGDGDPIHEIVIRGNQYTEANTVRAALEKGPAKIGAAVDALPKEVSTFEKVDFLIEEIDSRRTAIITAVEKPPALRFYSDGAPQIG